MKRLSVLVILATLTLIITGCSDNNAKNPPENILTAEQAQEIVFERAGVTAADVTELETELEYDDDWQGWEYSIDFNVGVTEYESEVNAESGTVIKFNKDKY